MKLCLLKHASLALLLTVVGCGKKANTTDSSPQMEIAPMAAEVDFKAKKEFLRAIKNNDLKALKEVLKYHPEIDLNMEFDDGNTPLITSIRNDSQSIRNYLMDKKVLLNKANINLETPLIVASEGSFINSVRVLIANKVDLNKKDATGETALHKAIKLQADMSLTKVQRKNSEEIALALIKAGASVEITDQENKNAYRLAQEYPNEKIMDVIQSIMNVELGTPNVATFSSVLSNGDIKSLNSILARFPRLPISYEAINPLVVAMENTDPASTLKMVQILLGYYVHVDGPSEAEMTPLIKSVIIGDLTLITTLLKSKANTTLVDKSIKSALYYAVEGNNPDAVQYLLNQNAPTHYTMTKNGKTVSFSACSIARQTEKTLTEAEDKVRIQRIKKSLGCSGWRSLF